MIGAIIGAVVFSRTGYVHYLIPRSSADKHDL